MNNTPRFIFLGTPDLAVCVLNKLAQAGHLPVLVVTAPDKPQGRKLKLTPPPVKVWAEEHEIPVLQPETLKDPAVHERLAREQCDVFILAAYGKIIPKEVLTIPPHGILNVHPSLLPKLRGAAPLQATILENEPPGVTIMLLDEGMDSGPIVAQEKIDIENFPIPAAELGQMLFSYGGEMLVRILPDWIRGDIIATPQDHSQATFTKKVLKEDAHIDLTADPEMNYRKILAYLDRPKPYFFAEKNDKQIRIIIKQARLENGELILEKVLPEGKREMSYEEYTRWIGNKSTA